MSAPSPGRPSSSSARGRASSRPAQAGNEDYFAAPAANQAFPVDRAPQALSFVSAPPSAAVAGITDYTVAAAATSGLPVALSVAQSSAAVCAIDDATVTAIAAGTCTIEANQSGDSAHHPAAQVQQSFTVGSPSPSLSAQTINFTSTPPAAAASGGPAYTVAATASSGLAVSFGATAGSGGVCTVSGSTVSLDGAGTCTVTADQPGSSAYHPAPQVQQSFTVGRASQAISFSSTPPVPAAVGGPDYVIAASAGSGLPVAFAVTAGSAGVCSVSGSAVSLLGAGTCTVVATQGGNAVYDPAAPVQQAFTVGPGAPTLSPQTISFTSTAPGVGRRRRRDLHRRRVGELGAPGRLHDRIRQCGRLHDLGRRGLDGRAGNLHDRREPGRQRQL